MKDILKIGTGLVYLLRQQMMEHFGRFFWRKTIFACGNYERKYQTSNFI